MKNIILKLSVILCIVLTSQIQQLSSNPIDHPTSFFSSEELDFDSVLKGVQEKVYNAFVSDLMSNTNVNLTKIKTNLSDIYKVREDKLITYWQAYTQFYLTIYFLQTKDNVNAKDAIDYGVDLMQNMKNKTSEDYALLSRLQSLSIQFAGRETVSVSRSMTKNGEIALQLDENNIRAYFVCGSNDFFTPKAYGGGEKAEEYFLKAISLPSQNIANEYMPSWGKEEAYEYLIKLYVKDNKLDNAKKYAEEALNLYPGNFIIREVYSEVQSKE